MDEVALHVGGKAFAGWKSIAIERSIEQLAGKYEFVVSDVAPDGVAATNILPGKRAAVSIDGEKVITGYIDEVEIAHSTEDHTLTVRGRDAAGDLVDSAAIFHTGQWSEQRMLSIAKDLLAPFKIPIRADVPLGDTFFTWNIEPGETVYENLDRMARHRGVLLVSDGLGGLVITKPGTSRTPTDLVLGQNILSGRSTVSFAQRFSEYLVLGQGLQQDAFDLHNEHGSSKDPAVGRYRPNIELFEDSACAFGSLQKRADWRRSVNAARGTRATIIVQGWRHAKGLWKPNTLVSVDDARLRFKKELLLIIGCAYKKDMDGGTRTELTLCRRNALNPETLPDAD